VLELAEGRGGTRSWRWPVGVELARGKVLEPDSRRFFAEDGRKKKRYSRKKKGGGALSVHTGPLWPG